MRFPKQKIQEWVNALRSGDYKQTRGYLQTSWGYCCLGVACDLFSPNHPKTDGILTGKGLPSRDTKDPQWIQDINDHIESKVGTTLGYANDEHKLNFNEIADLLQIAYLEKK